jgi:hypothetical protein
MSKSTATPAAPLGIFDPRLLYTADATKQLCGWGEWAFRQNRRRGLKVLVCGKSVFVRGSDLIAFVESQNQEK